MSRLLRLGPLRLLLALLLAACSGPAQPTPTAPPPTPALPGGVLATFEAVGETFHVWVTNPDTIAQLLALQAGESTASIPNGRILAGPGLGEHNAPWSWHLDPEDIDMADFSIELCDGAPSYVEENLSEYTDVIQRYCPWGAELKALDDRR
jgi:hypothetical protein